MDLKIKDIEELLLVPEKTVLEWIRENKIPHYRIQNQYRFNKAEINEWILKNKLAVSSKILGINLTVEPLSLLRLLKNGGIFFNVPGKTVKDAIRGAVKAMRAPADLDSKDIVRSLLEREKLMPTAVGKGVAIPHPRNPLLTDLENESLSICFLKNGIDYGALDKVPVRTLFIVLSANPKRHLEILSKISYLCQKDEWQELLNRRAPEEEILSFIGALETEWKKAAG